MTTKACCSTVMPTPWLGLWLRPFLWIGPTRLTFCFEKAGVMTDLDDESSVIPLVTAESFADLKEKGIVAKGWCRRFKTR